MEPPRPGLARKDNEPEIPEGVDTRVLHRAVRAELRGLPQELAEIVASHLVVAGQLVDDNPELAYAHAEAARRRAARLPIVREAAAETAYAAGLFDVALSEFRALRRMTGTHDYLPVMADCERALGRPHNALKLAKEADHLHLEPALQIEMIIVEAGARHDLGQDPEARRILERAVNTVMAPGDAFRMPYARLRYAYADALVRAGEIEEARQWFASAARLDDEQQTDAQQRVDEMDGMSIDFDETEDEDEDEELEAGPVGPDRNNDTPSDQELEASGDDNESQEDESEDDEPDDDSESDGNAEDDDSEDDDSEDGASEGDELDDASVAAPVLQGTGEHEGEVIETGSLGDAARADGPSVDDGEHPTDRLDA